MPKKSAAKKSQKTINLKNKKPGAKPSAKSSKKTSAKAASSPQIKRATAKTPKISKTSKTSKISKTSKTLKTLATPTKQKKSTKNAAKQDWAQTFSPLDDRVLVVREEASERTTGGLYIPESAGSGSGPQSGIVVAAGRGHRDIKGRLRPLDVQVNDRVLFAAHAGTEVEMQNQKITILREQDVLCVANI